MTSKPHELNRRIEGKVTSADDAGYEELRQGLVWNELRPARYPSMIAQVEDEADVVEAVNYARAEGLEVSVRGGGHSWIGFSLRDDSLLIDLAGLDQTSLDVDARTATVGPGATGRALNRQIAPLGLGFPVGHCPSVSLSGYLLNGGFGWNSNAWGPACFSVISARVVTADGEVVVADETRNTDLLWALRGGGPGFCGVITEYTVGLFDAPRDIRTNTYVYPLERLAEVGGWLGATAGGLPKEIEINLHIATPDRFLPDAPGGDFAAVVTATAFVDDETAAAAILGFMEDCPAAGSCFKKELLQPTPIEALAVQGERIYPARHRYRVNTLWTSADSAPMLDQARAQFERAPSRKSLALYGFGTGLAENAGPMPDVAFSMASEALLLHYAIWDDPADDAANDAWHRDITDALRPFALGHYIGESDIALEPARAERCFAPENWAKLQAIRKARDPDSLFVGNFESRSARC